MSRGFNLVAFRDRVWRHTELPLELVQEVFSLIYLAPLLDLLVVYTAASGSDIILSAACITLYQSLPRSAGHVRYETSRLQSLWPCLSRMR